MSAQQRILGVAVVLACIVLAASARAQVCGDADGNGSVTVTDGVQVLRAAAGLSSTCATRLAECDVDSNGNMTVTDGVNVLRAAAGLPVHLSCAPIERFVDNGDGTVTDNQTGLQWEKKTNLDGAPDFADLHDADNWYSWSTTGTAPDGTAFTQFLVALNTPPCFVAHCDWRLPTVGRNGDPAELETILLEPYPCGTSPCIDPIFGPTSVTSGYWSSTPGPSDLAWGVFFPSGLFYWDLRSNPHCVRVVRGGS